VSLQDLEQGFFYPIRTSDELKAIAEELSFYTYTSVDYCLPPAKVDGRFDWIIDILWLNGYLLVVDWQSGIHVLDSNLSIIDTINHIPGHRVFQVYAAATCEDGKLYAVINRHSETGRVGYSIAVFDQELNYEKAIEFILPISDRDVPVMPGSLAVNPDGGFALSLKDTPDADAAVIFFIDDNGTVIASSGNISLGHLLTHGDSLIFINRTFNVGMGLEGVQFGLSALFQLQKGEVVKREVLPGMSHRFLDDELVRAMEEVYIEINGQQPSDEWYADVYAYTFSAFTFTSLFHLRDNIAVIDSSGIMHMFDSGINYLYSRILRDQDYIIDYSQNYRKELANDINRKYTRILAACADDEGNIYIVQEIAYRHSINGADTEIGIQKINLADLP
jgi:hypothetical protein